MYPTNYEEILQIMSDRMSGENNPAWRGGHYIFYPPEFSKRLRLKIKDRDKHKCSLCENSLDILHVHHIDYNKCNNNFSNLITLCPTCHIRTNFNRMHWENRLKRLINIWYGNQQPS